MMKKLVSVLLAITMLFAISVTAFAAPPADLITEENAKSIALKDAGFEEDEVKYLKVKLDFDDGRYEYEVEFYVGNAEEYDYTIDAKSGKIIDYDYDYDPPYGENDKYPDFDDKIEDKVDSWFIQFLLELIDFLRSFIAKAA